MGAEDIASTAISYPHLTARSELLCLPHYPGKHHIVDLRTHTESNVLHQTITKIKVEKYMTVQPSNMCQLKDGKRNAVANINKFVWPTCCSNIHLNIIFHFLLIFQETHLKKPSVTPYTFVDKEQCYGGICCLLQTRSRKLPNAPIGYVMSVRPSFCPHTSARPPLDGFRDM
jgi:hypothetical protein